MRSSVHTVRSDIHFQHVVALYIIILLGRSSYNCISRQYDNTGMVCPDTDLVFRTDHSVRLDAADLRPFDRKDFVTVIEFRTVHSDNHFLACCDIRCATNDLQRCFTAYIYCSNMQVIWIRVFHTGQDFTDNQSFQATFDSLNFFYSPGFQTDRG